MLAAARQPSGAAAGQQQLRIHQLGAVLDLLTEATNRLALVGTLSGASPSSNHLTAGDSTPASYMPEALKRHQAGQKESRD